MIGKLIKHDLIAGARRMGNIYLAAVIACAALLFSSLVKSGFLRFLSSAAVFVIACIAVVVTFASVVFGANKTLFGREGYLTQTLPVRTSSLIFSKWITSSFWVLISYGLAAAVGILLFVYWTSENQDGAQMYEIIYSFAQSFGLGGESVYQKYLIISAVIGLFNACILVMFIIFSITLSNVRPLNKLGSFGIIIFLALTVFAVQGLSYGLEALCDISLVIEESGMSMTVDPAAVETAIQAGGLAIGFTSVYFKAVVTVFIYIFTVILTETKINLK